MIKQGFDETGERLTNLEQGQKALEQGQEEIKLNLTNVAYRFELVELQKEYKKLKI